jgi:hypothetical protein
MITLTKCVSTDVSIDELERLYSEAYTHISEERKRLGEEQLKNALVNDIHGYPMIKYEVDGYLVAIASYTNIHYDGKPYLLHRHPIYGCDINGSKAWWYSEEFQSKFSQYLVDNGYTGIITIINPNSPAAKAVISHFGFFEKHLNKPYVLKDLSGTGIALNDETLSVLVIDVNNNN